MNGIEKLTGRIAAQGKEEIAAIEAKAESEAKAIREKYGKQAEEAYDAVVKRGQEDAQQRIERGAGVARLEAKKKLLATRQDLVTQAFDLALVKMATLPARDTICFLSSLAVEAARTGTEELIFSPDDREKLGEEVVAAANQALAAAGKPASLILSRDTRPMRGGFIMKDREVEINCTYETLIRLHRETLSGEVAQILF